MSAYRIIKTAFSNPPSIWDCCLLLQRLDINPQWRDRCWAAADTMPAAPEAWELGLVASVAEHLLQRFEPQQVSKAINRMQGQDLAPGDWLALLRRICAA